LLYHSPKFPVPLAQNQPLYCIADSRIKTTLQQQQAGRGTTIYNNKYGRVKGRGTTRRKEGKEERRNFQKLGVN
jgi:hypothetical protein